MVMLAGVALPQPAGLCADICRVAEMGVFPPSVARKLGIFPVPEAASPTAGLSLTQLKFASATPLFGATAVLKEPVQIVWLAPTGRLITGWGLTVTSTVCVLAQPLAASV